LASTVQFDEMFTIGHTKLKPLSITVTSDADRWKILGFTAALAPMKALRPETNCLQNAKRSCTLTQR